MKEDTTEAQDHTFEFNEEVIWDSHLGYEIGYFLGQGNQYETFLIDIKSGIIHEPMSLAKNHIFKYSTKLVKELTKKYGYERKF